MELGVRQPDPLDSMVPTRLLVLIASQSFATAVRRTRRRRVGGCATELVRDNQDARTSRHPHHRPDQGKSSRLQRHLSCSPITPSCSGTSIAFARRATWSSCRGRAVSPPSRMEFKHQDQDRDVLQRVRHRQLENRGVDRSLSARRSPKRISTARRSKARAQELPHHQGGFTTCVQPTPRLGDGGELGTLTSSRSAPC